MEDATGFGYWQLTVLMVVLASWLLYRYATPQSWREWTGAGMVQAFIVALYAEMYGFPLTIYLLSGFLGLDVPWLHDSGHLWAALFGLGPVAAMVEMIVGYALVFLGVSLLIRGWREVYLATAEQRLATDGLYDVVRHPQYTGIGLAVLGQLIHWPTLPTLLLFPVIVVVYVRLASREEAAMLARFGDDYRAYHRRVPKFVPRWGEWQRLISPTLPQDR